MVYIKYIKNYHRQTYISQVTWQEKKKWKKNSLINAELG